MGAFAVLACGVLIAAAGCSSPLTGTKDSAPQSRPAPDPDAFVVGFAESVPYADALRGLTDIGVQPSVNCGSPADRAAGRLIQDFQWKPAGQRDVFVQTHLLWVTSTPLAPEDEQSRLRALPAMAPPNPSPTGSCFVDVGQPRPPAPPAAGTSLVVTADQLTPLVYARATFSGATSYDAALSAVSDLGVRLADPCYERALQHAHSTGAQPPTWHAMGQETAYGHTQTLVVAPSALITPSDWRARLVALPGVTTVQVPYVAPC